MNRTLKPSIRPFVVFAVIFGAMSLLGFYKYFQFNQRPDLLKPALLPIGLYIGVMALLCSTRISVSSDGLTIVRWYVARRFIPFTDIDHSDVQILAERNWPVQITIHSKHRVLTQIGLKAIQQRDAAWLCSLPELKCVTHPGLTRRA